MVILNTTPPPLTRHPLCEKPIIILVCPNRFHFVRRYHHTLVKLQRDVRLKYAINVGFLNFFIEMYSDDIAGFIVVDGKVMDPENEALSRRLATLVEVPNREWAVVFALDFPSWAAQQPVQFSRYMKDYFGLEWRICGATRSKIGLQLREQTLRKMGPRVYRSEYAVRGVFLRGVKQSDKLLLATGVFGPGGQPDPSDDRAMCASPTGEMETETTVEDVELGSIDGDWEEGGEGGSCVDGGGLQDGRPALGLGEEVIVHQEAENEWADDELTDIAETEEEEWYDSQNDGEEEEEDDDDDGNRTYSPSAHHFVRVHPRASLQSPLRHGRMGGQSGFFLKGADPDWVPSDDEGTDMNKLEADSPVVIHEVKTWAKQENGSDGDDDDEVGEEVMVRGYIGFVGQYEDSPSMASLILGMCSVQPWKPTSQMLTA